MAARILICTALFAVLGCGAPADDEEAGSAGDAVSAAGERVVTTTSLIRLHKEPSRDDMGAEVDIGTTVRWTDGPEESGFDHIEVMSEGWLKGKTGWVVRGCPGSIPRFSRRGDTTPELLLCNPSDSRSIATATDLGTMTVVPASLRALEDLEPIGGPQWYSFKVDSGSKRNPVISVEVDTTFPIAVFFTCDAKPNTSTCKTGVPTTNEELGAGCRSAVRTEPATALTKKTRVSLTTECERGVAYVWLGTDEGTERYYSAQMTVTP